MANVILRVVLLRLRLNPIGIADGRDYLQRALRNERRKEVFDLLGVRIRLHRFSRTASEHARPAGSCPRRGSDNAKPLLQHRLNTTIEFGQRGYEGTGGTPNLQVVLLHPSRDGLHVVHPRVEAIARRRHARPPGRRDEVSRTP